MKANRRRKAPAKDRRQKQPDNRWMIGAAAVFVVALVGFVYAWSNRGAAELPPATPYEAETAPLPNPPPPVAETTPAPLATAAVPPAPVPNGAMAAESAAAQPAPPAAIPNPEIRRISVDELREAMAGGEVFVVDVRSADSYAAQHIPGAAHIPLGDVAKSIDSLPRDTMIVTYCT